MTVHRHLFRALAAPAFALALPFTAAGAFELEEFGDRFKAVLETQGIIVDWQGISGDENEVVLDGMTTTLEGLEDSAEVGQVRLTNITEDDDHYHIETLRLPNYDIEEDEMSLRAWGITLTGLQIPYDIDAENDLGVLIYESFDLENIAVSASGREVFTLEQLHVGLDAPEEDGAPFAFSGAAERFTADLSELEDPDAAAVVAAMGYQTISGYFELTGSWSPGDGQLALDQYDIAVEDAGTFGITMDLAGYTPEFIKSLREMQSRLAESTEENQAAQGLAMLGLMQQIGFTSASIRFDDDSLTGRVLALLAEQQGVQPSDIANQAKAILPFLLGQLGAPEFAAQVSAAVNAFLDDPQSIEISAAPAATVPFAAIMATAMSTPQALIEQLGVSVSANQ